MGQGPPVFKLITLPYKAHTIVANNDTNSTERKLRYKMYLAACLRAASPEGNGDREGGKGEGGVYMN